MRLWVPLSAVHSVQVISSQPPGLSCPPRTLAWVSGSLQVPSCSDPDVSWAFGSQGSMGVSPGLRPFSLADWSSTCLAWPGSLYAPLLCPPLFCASCAVSLLFDLTLSSCLEHQFPVGKRLQKILRQISGICLSMFLCVFSMCACLFVSMLVSALA